MESLKKHTPRKSCLKDLIIKSTQKFYHFKSVSVKWTLIDQLLNVLKCMCQMALQI